MKDEYREWYIIQSVQLGGSANDVWDVVGGFFNIHKWHPDIALTEILDDQLDLTPLRRLLTFPGQPKTTEELILMDNEGFHYRYKWYSGEWGEKVKDYVADIRVFDVSMDGRCIVQWSSTFRYTEDAVSSFYQHGFDVLEEMFPD